LPGRFSISGDWGRIRGMLYRVAIFLGWRPILPPASGSFDDEDWLLRSGVPRRPPD